jgi:hypothetical protein
MRAAAVSLLSGGEMTQDEKLEMQVRYFLACFRAMDLAKDEDGLERSPSDVSAVEASMATLDMLKEAFGDDYFDEAGISLVENPMMAHPEMLLHFKVLVAAP